MNTIWKDNADGRAKSEDRFVDGHKINISEQPDGRIQAKRNRRSRRLQKKNSLDVQFRRRFSMLKDGNAAANNIYNESINEAGFNGLANAIDLDTTTHGIANAAGRDSRNSSMMPGLGPRASSGNLSNKILDKRFNKMLFNMHGIPVKPNVTNQQQNNKKDKAYPQMTADLFQQPNQLSAQQQPQPKVKGNRKRKTPNIVEQNVWGRKWDIVKSVTGKPRMFFFNVYWIQKIKSVI